MPNSQSKLPLSVVLIALFQFAKATVLLIVFWMMMKAPEMLEGSHLAPLLMFIASHGKAPQGAVVALLAIYPIVIGAGLLLTIPWARRTLMFTSGLTIALWARALLMNQMLSSGNPLQQNILLSSEQQQAVLALLLTDALVLFYLWMGQGVQKAFSVNPY
jgi:hypothetical protein